MSDVEAARVRIGTLYVTLRIDVVSTKSVFHMNRGDIVTDKPFDIACYECTEEEGIKIAERIRQANAWAVDYMKMVWTGPREL